MGILNTLPAIKDKLRHVSNFKCLVEQKPVESGSPKLEHPTGRRWEELTDEQKQSEEINRSIIAHAAAFFGSLSGS